MAWTPISNTVPQYEEDGVAASGFYIKFYEAGTTTPTAMATDSTGATLLDKCELNTEGYPKNGSNAVFIPHIDRRYKIALFRNATDADNNNLNNAVWPVDNLSPFKTDDSVIQTQIDTIALLRSFEPTTDGQQVSLLGHTLPGLGAGEFYFDESDTTSADNNGTIIVTTGGKRWRRSDISIIELEMFGVVGDGSDEFLNIDKALTYCKINNTPILLGDLYGTSQTLDFGNLVVSGGGTEGGSEVRATAAGILLAKTSAHSKLTNIYFNGNGLALWGLMVSSNRPYCEKIDIRNCTEYGWVFNQTQNAGFVNCSAIFNATNLAFFNGVRNCSFYNLGTSLGTSGTPTLRTVNSREMLFDFNTSDPHGFGLDTNIVASGNDNIRFFGGISESSGGSNQADFLIESSDTSATGSSGGTKYFYGYELSSGQGLITSSNPSKFVFNGSYTLFQQGKSISVGVSPSSINVDEHTYNGGVNSTDYMQGLGNAYTKEMSRVCVSTNRFTDEPDNLVGVGAAVVWDSPTRTFTVTTGVNGNQGLELQPSELYNNLGSQSATILSKQAAADVGMWRVSFYVKSITGGATVSFGFTSSLTPFRQTVSTHAVGAHTIVHKPLVGAYGTPQLVMFAAGGGGATEFEISDIMWELI